MRHWFQNLKKEDREKRWFHFRGSVSTDRRHLFSYSAWSGRAFKFEITHGAMDEDKTQLWLGLLFFTVCITVQLPDRWYFRRKCIATWDNNREFWLIDGREYGFYMHEWALVWFWHKRVNESSGRTPWWRGFYFRIDDFFLGRTEYMEQNLTKAEGVAFKVGGKQFVMDSIRWYDATWFRRRIPLALHSNRCVRVQMEIKKPPMRAGKGENSWDLDDDGSFGLTTTWEHARPTWLNVQEMERLAVEDYVKYALKDAKRYGAGSGERGIKASDVFEYVGRVTA